MKNLDFIYSIYCMYHFHFQYINEYESMTDFSFPVIKLSFELCF